MIRIRGLPASAREEFSWTHRALLEVLAKDSEQFDTPQALYDNHQIFRTHFDRCLELFLIPRSNISVGQGWDLLFGEDPSQAPLIELEFPTVDRTGPEEGEPLDDSISSASRMLVALWSHTGDISQALELFEDRRLPGRRLQEILQEKNRLDRRAAMTTEEKAVSDGLEAMRQDELEQGCAFDPLFASIP